MNRLLSFSALWSIGFHLGLLSWFVHSSITPSIKAHASTAKTISISIAKEKPKNKPKKEIEKTLPEPKEPVVQKEPVPALKKVKPAVVKKSVVPVKKVVKPDPVQTPQPSVESVSSAAWKSAEENYFGKVVALIAKQKEYPRRASRLGLQGTAEISIQIAEDGKLLFAKLLNKSSSVLFDREAVRMAEAAAPFPPPPPLLIQRSPVKMSIPIIFKMK